MKNLAARCALKAKSDVHFTRGVSSSVTRDEQTEIVDRIKSALMCRLRATKLKHMLKWHTFVIMDLMI